MESKGETYMMEEHLRSDSKRAQRERAKANKSAHLTEEVFAFRPGRKNWWKQKKTGGPFESSGSQTQAIKKGTNLAKSSLPPADVLKSGGGDNLTKRTGEKGVGQTGEDFAPWPSKSCRERKAKTLGRRWIGRLLIPASHRQSELVGKKVGIHRGGEGRGKRG